MSQKLKDGQSKIYRKAKWALFDRQNLRNIVERFQKRNKTLREILQFAMAGILQQVAKRGQGFNSLQQDQDAVALGLNTWAEIRQIKDQPERIDQDYSIGNCTVNTMEDTSIIRLPSVRQCKKLNLVRTRSGRKVYWSSTKPILPHRRESVAPTAKI